MEIVLVVAIVVVAATGLFVATTFNRRARQTAAPLIAAAVSDISEQLKATADDLRRQLEAIAADLHRDRDQLKLDGRKIQGRLDHADSQISGLADRFATQLGALERRGEQIGTQQDQLTGDLRHLALRLGAEPGRLYAERLSFSTAPAPSGPEVRIVVERQVRELPLGPFRGLGDAPAIISRAESDAGFRDRLGQAAADYLVAKVDPAFAVITEGWVMRDAFPETAAAGVCDRIGDGLHAIAATPLNAIGTEIRLPGPVAAAGAGIGADLILQPVTRPLGQVTRFLEITGVVVGVATGLHPLALAAGKMLAHDAAHRLMAREITAAAHLALAGPEPASPPGRTGPTRALEGPAASPDSVSTLDLGLGPVQDPRSRTAADLDGPSIGGPGLL